ncbi:MAG: 4-hydroxy-3-methylbut-2-enyl diphosphate reductase [Caldiserica bacterium]|nr:4-hydroxy-3-methylbut-2-enyl diphosphate reductase [Caldisericota bacterium]
MPDMRVVLAHDLGYCSGIRRAIDAAETALRSGGPIAATDTLLHNAGEMNRLRSMGLRSVELLSDEELGAATVLLPAHGSTLPERLGRISGARAVLDLTCPIVNRARDVAGRFADAGVSVVVVGDKEHRETRYLMEAAGRQLLRVVASEQDLDMLETSVSRVGVVYQTTQSREFRQQVLEWFRSRGIEVVEEMTLCPEVLRRQDAAGALARRCTVMLVLGDSSSANTRRLVAVAGSICHKTYLLQDVAELGDLGLDCGDIVGVVSGTSCPPMVIDQVVEGLRRVCADVSVELEA